MNDKFKGCLVPTSYKGALRVVVALLGVALASSSCFTSASAQELMKIALPEAPSSLLATGAYTEAETSPNEVSSSSQAQTAPQGTSPTLQTRSADDKARSGSGQVLDEHGKVIRPQTGRIFGIFPNFVSVSGGTRPKPAGWKTDFQIANKQSYDYSSFGFLLISSSLAYAQTSHPSLNTVDGGNAILWAYVWRGFLDKTDGSYQGSFLFPALLHEDTRYFALGTGSPKKRLLHAALSVVVAHNYNQQPIFNAAGLLGKAGAQAVSTTYYPAGSEGFGVLAEKFSYACLRQAIYAIVREYSPDAQARVHYSQKADKP